MRPYKVLRDPVHGDIGIPRELLRLCDTPEFQRLRGIKMLGTASLVYPGATHTRFEHSLGTCHLTQTLLDKIGEPPDLAVLAAALLHDVTHIPFGHTIEDERRVFARHDSPERIRNFLPRGELGKVLKELALLEPVLDILSGPSGPAWRQQIFSGTVCADLLDYIARDSYYCGLSQRYDSRILSSFGLDASGDIYLNAFKSGLVRHDVVSEVIHLLRIRYFLSERVYFHHTKTASGAMISRAVEEAIHQGLTLEDLERLGDETLLYCLHQNYTKNPIVATLMEHLRGHHIYKQTYVITRQVGEERRQKLVQRYHLSPTERAAAERELTRNLKLKEGQLIIYCPALRMQLKEADVKVKVDEGPPRLLSALGLPELETLKERHQDLWKLYVFTDPDLESKALKVAQACEKYFGEANHLPALRGGQLYFQF